MYVMDAYDDDEASSSCMYACMYMICMYVCMCKSCMYVYVLYTGGGQRDRETERQRDGEIEKSDGLLPLSLHTSSPSLSPHVLHRRWIQREKD